MQIGSELVEGAAAAAARAAARMACWDLRYCWTTRVKRFRTFLASAPMERSCRQKRLANNNNNNNMTRESIEPNTIIIEHSNNDILLPSIDQPTAEMVEFFEQRTRRHIALVQKNCARIAEGLSRVTSLPPETDNDDDDDDETNTKAHLDSSHSRFHEMLKDLKARLLASCAVHDASKFVEPERTPYVRLTWWYHQTKHGAPFDLTKTTQ
mmetsp:Transcript_9647/g.20779  ORF Transcript_9647/g.20779 Transcript_9647/m.20779 type:complete len:210 (-) Transcript_9647:469-1098(-)